METASILEEKIEKAAAYLGAMQERRARIAVVLGSGLGGFGEQMEDVREISYDKIPHFPASTVPGHAGKLIMGKAAGKEIIALSGRFHYYEGYDMQAVSFPMRVLQALGVRLVILTNAAGGINLDFAPGDLMAISDHIKFFDESPLRGPNLEGFGPRFCDMSDVYAKKYRALLKQAAKDAGISLKEGVYAYMSGPSFETPAEIRTLRALGADAVGMSTVPEAIVCAHGGTALVGISCISNMAAGILDQPLSHDEVMETGRAVSEKFTRLVMAFLDVLDEAKLGE